MGFAPCQYRTLTRDKIYSTEVMYQKTIYIHQNLVRKNLVENPEDWKYSSIFNYLTR